MVKNIKQFLKEAKDERNLYLKCLTLTKAAKILEDLLLSKIWKACFYPHTDTPQSIKNTLNHAKFSR